MQMTAPIARFGKTLPIIKIESVILINALSKNITMNIEQVESKNENLDAQSSGGKFVSQHEAQKKHREELITMKSRSEGTRIDSSPLFAYGRYYPEKLGALPFKKGGSFQMVMIRKRTKEIHV